MERFLDWFAAPGEMNPFLMAGLAHLWFLTIHPFVDGNGLITRAIADMTLTRAAGVVLAILWQPYRSKLCRLSAFLLKCAVLQVQDFSGRFDQRIARE